MTVATFDHTATKWIFPPFRPGFVGRHYLIRRTSWVYAGRGINFVLTVLRLAREKPELPMVNDQIGSPTWARALAEVTAELLKKKALREQGGTYHLSASGAATRYEFANEILTLAQELSEQTAGWATLRPILTAEYPLPARRPLTCITSKEKIKRVFGIEMPDWRSQLRSCLAEFFASVEWQQRLRA